MSLEPMENLNVLTLGRIPSSAVGWRQEACQDSLGKQPAFQKNNFNERRCLKRIRQNSRGAGHSASFSGSYTPIIYTHTHTYTQKGIFCDPFFFFQLFQMGWGGDLVLLMIPPLLGASVCYIKDFNLSGIYRC